MSGAFPALIAGISDNEPLPGGDCGCCDGIAPVTPLIPANRPGLAAIAYVPGRYADFLESELAALSAHENPALSRLQSRETDDFSIALLDAWAVTLDVLSFYQERIANESYLPTATERRSLVELGRLIGYRLRPGVAASTDLVFLMDNPPGAEPGVTAVDIETGTQVQSVPGPGESAVTFETIAPVAARVAWNGLAPRQTRRLMPKNGDTGLWLAGVATGLKAGDAILIVGAERAEEFAGSEQWDFRRLIAVEADLARNRTFIAFTHPLGSVDPPGLTAQREHRLFALRSRAALFGWNAPHPNLLTAEARTLFGVTAGHDWSFDIDTAGRRIMLDSPQEGFVAGGWVVLTRPAAFVEAYRIEEAVEDGMSAYAVSGRGTRLTLDSSEHLSWFESDYRRVAVYGKSEELAIADTPIVEPVMGDTIELANRPEPMEPGRRLAIRGRRAEALITADLTLAALSGGDTLALAEGTRVTLIEPPVPVAPGAADHVWTLRAPGGFAGTVTAPLTRFTYVAATTSEIVAEPAVLKALSLADETHMILELEEALGLAFDHATTLVHGNVAPATHGETVEEILGDGRSAAANQHFTLKDLPVTHVAADSETGAASTLQIRVNDVLWHERPTLYGAGPRERVFASRIDDDGRTIVTFGDGVFGARLPTGRNNVVATYRKGIGRAGSVGAGKLTTALDRPLGLREVTNPMAAAGGEDAETLDGARDNAPVTTLTLGRVVSLQNYEDFAHGFAGIAKAKADFAWDGESRRILLSIAGPGGEAIDPTDKTYVSLVGALRRYGDPFVRVAVASYRPATFRLALKLKIDPDYVPDAVLAAVETALRAAYSLEARGFASLIAASEIFAIAHGVAGVIAADLDLFHRTTPPNAAVILHQRLLAEPARLSPSGGLIAAEILTLDPGPIALSVLS